MWKFILYYFPVVILLTLFDVNNAVEINCRALQPAECKEKFGIEFKSEFFELDTIYIRSILTQYKGFYVDYLKELSPESRKARQVKRYISDLEDGLTKLNKNELRQEAMLALILQSYSLSDRKLDGVVAREVEEFMESVGNAWSKLYKGLRKKDLEAYPKLVDFNMYLTQYPHEQSPIKAMSIEGTFRSMFEFFEFNDWDKVLLIF